MKINQLWRPFGGMTQWLYQRFTALYMIIYLTILTSIILLLKPITFTIWSSLFALWYVKIATVLFFYLMFFHAWIGVLHITEDYVKVMWFKKIINIGLFLTMVSQMIYLTYFLVRHSYE